MALHVDPSVFLTPRQTKVYDEDGNLLGTTLTENIRHIATPDEYRRKSSAADGKLWCPKAGDFVKNDRPIPRYGIAEPYSKDWERELSSAFFGTTQHYVDKTLPEPFDELLVYLDENQHPVAWNERDGNCWTFCNDVKAGTKLLSSRHPHTDDIRPTVDGNWGFASPADLGFYLAGKSRYGRKSSFEEVKESLEVAGNVTLSNVFDIHKSFGGAGILPKDRFEFHLFDKETTQKVLRIAYYATMGWSLWYKGESLFFWKECKA